ncbi:uncharacterized protein LOC126784215 [Argentina anserina]|uniref:uncharacterized protein LOC126784215 n=1 Tax=Argentina anserina TaxID=57926 RepID=UPI0021766B79|nr:uncharacterized protein LOC126784215 [Potentilla anserina]
MVAFSSSAVHSICDEPPDLEKQQLPEDAADRVPNSDVAPPLLNVVVVTEPPAPFHADSSKEVKGHLSRYLSAQEQCRVCQQDKDEALIDLGCHCRGGLEKAHRSCIEIWFQRKGSNICEICEGEATNVEVVRSPGVPLGRLICEIGVVCLILGTYIFIFVSFGSWL